MARSRFLRAGRLRRSCRVRRPWLGQSPDSRNAGAAVVHNFVEGRYRRVPLKSLKSIVTEGAGELTWDVETRLTGWACKTRTQESRGKISLCKVAQISGDQAEC